MSYCDDPGHAPRRPRKLGLPALVECCQIKAVCEGCHRRILHGQRLILDLDGIELCEGCASAMLHAHQDHAT